MRVILALTALFATFALAACRDAGNGAGAPTTSPLPAPRTIAVGPNKPVVIGLSAALTGDQKDLGSDLVAGAILAVGQFGNFVKGHPIELSPLDDGCGDAQRAALVAAAFSKDDALAGVVGPMCTNGAQAANPHYESAEVIHISPSSSRVDLSEQGERFFFRTVWRDDAQAYVQATYARSELGAAAAVVVSDSEPYGNALASEFAAQFRRAGGRVLSELRIKRGEANSSALAGQIVDAKPDVVVFEGFNPEGALLAAELVKARYAGHFMGPDGLLSARDFLTTAGPAAEGAIITGGASPAPGFVQTFVALYGRAPATTFVLQAHDAVTALLKAFDTAATVASDGSVTVDREALAEALRAQRMAGFTGSIAFDEKGDRRGETPTELGITVYRVQNGNFVAVQ